jgi:hypothetical protein
MTSAFRIIGAIVLLIVVLLAGGTLLASLLRDRLFDLEMGQLDDWVKDGGEISTLQSDLVGPCTDLVVSQAGALERLELIFILRDELDFRSDVCIKMTANRLYKQPEFEKAEITNMICDDPRPYHELFRLLCSRSGLRPPK